MSEIDPINDEFNDPDATACANGDYNTWEEDQVALDRASDEGMPEVEDELFDQMMEDRIGGTGVEDFGEYDHDANSYAGRMFEEWEGDSDGSVGED
jgi:hypothetical protein